jgi:multisubunit Na+/H+ antiporter MnhC subunit
MVGVLLGTGAYLMLRRDPIKLVLGFTLFSFGINLVIFGTGNLYRGAPPILDKETFAGDLSNIVDPLPQALILTAIVISFGITAFIVVLINLRNTLIAQRVRQSGTAPDEIVGDPFASAAHYLSGLDQDPDDYEWLEYLTDDAPQRQYTSEERQREREIV